MKNISNVKDAAAEYFVKMIDKLQGSRIYDPEAIITAKVETLLEGRYEDLIKFLNNTNEQGKSASAVDTIVCFRITNLIMKANVNHNKHFL